MCLLYISVCKLMNLNNYPILLCFIKIIEY